MSITLRMLGDGLRRIRWPPRACSSEAAATSTRIPAASMKVTLSTSRTTANGPSAMQRSGASCSWGADHVDLAADYDRSMGSPADSEVLAV